MIHIFVRMIIILYLNRLHNEYLIFAIATIKQQLKVIYFYPMKSRIWTFLAVTFQY